MPRSLFRIVLLAALFFGILPAQEEEAPVGAIEDEEEEQQLEWSGNLDMKYTLMHMDQRSAQYQMQFWKLPPASSFFSQYRLEPYINADYHNGEVGFVLKTHGIYYSDANARFDLFESYGSYNPSSNIALQAGKRVYSWGKGYAFNPVGYINPVKDPENPELAQAGVLSANVEYIKSIESDALQNFALMVAVVPSTEILNGRYGDVERTNIAVKSYFLLWDTDIDVMTYFNGSGPDKYGFDFSRNLKENIEIHGEVSLSYDVARYSIERDSLNVQVRDDAAYIFGVRYLTESNVTLIAEYYHNELGMQGSDYQQYSDYLIKSILSNNTAFVQSALNTTMRYFRGNTLMQDYFYAKIIYPEPFDLLYFTPSLYTIYNISDNSYLLSMQLNYKPVTNIEFILWPTILAGDSKSEYGGKQVQEKIEAWMRVFF